MQMTKPVLRFFSFHVDCVLLLSSHITNLDFQMFMHFLQKPRFSVQDFPKRKQLPWTALSRDWIFDSSSEVWEEEEGSTSLTPESAGLGGREPGVIIVSYHSGIQEILLFAFAFCFAWRQTGVYHIQCWLFTTYQNCPTYVRSELGWTLPRWQNNKIQPLLFLFCVILTFS